MHMHMCFILTMSHPMNFDNNNRQLSTTQHFQLLENDNLQDAFDLSQLGPNVVYTWLKDDTTYLPTQTSRLYNICIPLALYISTSNATYQKTNPAWDTNHLSLEQLGLVSSLSDATLCAAGNLAYLRLEKENLALCDRVDNLQCVIC
jgi:hypothetical protein